MKRLWWQLWCVCGLLFVALSARAQGYAPPALAGHVTDAAGKLSAHEVARLDAKLAEYRRCSTNHVAVFVARSLDGYSVEEVAFAAFGRWKLGEASKGNGALLVIAPAEREARIATGEGVGGSLNDVPSGEIVRQRVSPRLAADDVFGAIDGGTTGIELALGGCETHAAPAPSPAGLASPGEATPDPRPAAPPAPAPNTLSLSLAAVTALTLLLAVGARTAPFEAIVLLFLTGVFCVLTLSLFGPTAPRVGAALLVAANAVVWRRRLRGLRRDSSPESPPFRASSGGDSSGLFTSAAPNDVVGASDTGWPSASTSLTGSSSSSDSSSSSSSSSSSEASYSSDSRYSGGGGGSGGGGAGDGH